MFDWLGSNPWWAAFIVVALLVVIGIIVVFLLSRRSQGAIEPENLLQKALQLLNTSRMDDAILRGAGARRNCRTAPFLPR